ncbi:MAG: glucose 1-dehydrogenase [Chloroflexi bacterium]|nr:glucose 1-dehydrogenase [Chloroflexota bacterium]
MRVEKQRVDGKVAVVTGGAGGIGAATARLLAREGAAVVIGDLLEEQGRAVETQIAEVGGQALFVPMDVTSENDWRRAIQAAVAAYGKLDILVNNAGISGRNTVEETSVELWDRVMAVNAKGVFLGTKLAIPEMRKAGGGSIINVSSIWGLVGSDSSTAYHSAKGAVRIFTKAAAVQYAKEGIRVNSVHPGFVDSPMTIGYHALPGVRETRVAATPLGRMGTPEDIASGILYLASDESSFVTGSELVIDGGMTAQ